MYDENGNWIEDSGTIADPITYPNTNETTLPITGTGTDSSSGAYYDAFGNSYTSEVDAKAADANVSEAAAAGATQLDENGNWYDAAGKLIKQLAPLSPILKSITAPILNNIMSGGLMNQASDLLRQGGSGISNIASPNLMSLIPQLKLQVQQGTMSPAQYSAIMASVIGKMDAAHADTALQSDSNMGGVKTDQNSLGGARAALAQLADIGANKGMTEADRAQFAATMNQANANAAQQRAAQLQQLQMQGNAGTGAELATRLSGVQGTANSNAAAGANLASNAQARALAAIQAGVTGNTNLNSQLFTQDADKAKAQDVVNAFNTSAKNAMNLSNTANQQQANLSNFNTGNQFALANQTAGNTAAQNNATNQQQSNLTNFNMANSINKDNTGILNQQALMPLNVSNQQFKNALDQQKAATGAQINAGTALGNMATGQITRSATAGGNAPATSITTSPTSAAGSSGGNSSGGILDNIGKAVNIGSTLWDLFSDEKLKTDKKELKDDDVDEMMAQMTGYKYRYKGDKSNPQKTGVMAQDMEEGMGSVINTPAGKMIQGPEAIGKALAILANQHSRIKKLEGK